ncbi:MAG: hypothetical protein RJA44_1152 [Pseudomonadota bacterium]
MFTDLIPASPDAPARTEPSARERFMRLLQTALERGELVRLTLGQPRDAADPSLDKVLGRLIRLRGQSSLQLVWRHRTRDLTQNHPIEAALAQIDALIGTPFRHAHLQTRREDVQLSLKEKGGRDRSQLRIGKLPQSDAAPDEAAEDGAGAHNREKQRLLPLDLACWTDLGLTTPQHQLIPSMARKWRQINKFIEVCAGALRASPLAGRDPAEPVRVLDFGCGKGYLTFAVHAWLQAQQRSADVVGVELREELVQLCNASAARQQLQGLRFDAGDVRHYAQVGIDMMIALHACDIATDHAIHFGLRAGASIIVCSPCCHKEIRPQLQCPPLLRPLLQHGVHLGQEAEMVTDSLRALLLDAEGYDTQVFEFISLEHTNKNKMILAVRRARPDPARREQILAQIEQIKQFYGLRSHCLEQLLQAEPLQRDGSATAA